jgi:hypothetical protein
MAAAFAMAKATGGDVAKAVVIGMTNGAAVMAMVPMPYLSLTQIMCVAVAMAGAVTGRAAAVGGAMKVARMQYQRRNRLSLACGKVAGVSECAETANAVVTVKRRCKHQDSLKLLLTGRPLLPGLMVHEIDHHGTGLLKLSWSGPIE